jgi:hypothetical protein
MIVERTDSEIVVRLPLGTKLNETQDILDFLKYKEIVSTSKADDNEINQLIASVKSKMHESFVQGQPVANRS